MQAVHDRLGRANDVPSGVLLTDEKHGGMKRSLGMRALSFSHAGSPAATRPRALAISCVAALTITFAWSTHADTGKTEICAQDANRGQLLRDDGKLVQARQRFVECARAACP